jgi:energy-coupling factor transporter transmembrane protein EcfT
MTAIAYSRKRRLLMIGFFVFSIVFIISGIPNVFRESTLYGSGYFQSLEFLKTLLTFVPFILCTIYVWLLIRNKYVLLFNEKGITYRDHILKEAFVPWNDINTIEIKKTQRSYYLWIRIKSNISQSRKRKSESITIPLKNVDCDILEINDFLTKRHFDTRM